MIDYRLELGKARSFIDIKEVFEAIFWPLSLSPPKRTGIEFIDAERLWKLAKARVARVTTLTEGDGAAYWRAVTNQFKLLTGV